MLLASMPSYSHPQYRAMLMNASSSGDDALYLIGLISPETGMGLTSSYF